MSPGKNEKRKITITSKYQLGTKSSYFLNEKIKGKTIDEVTPDTPLIAERIENYDGKFTIIGTAGGSTEKIIGDKAREIIREMKRK